MLSFRVEYYNGLSTSLVAQSSNTRQNKFKNVVSLNYLITIRTMKRLVQFSVLHNVKWLLLLSLLKLKRNKKNTTKMSKKISTVFLFLPPKICRELEILV